VCSNDDPSGQATSAALQPNRQQPMRISRPLGSRQVRFVSVFAIDMHKSSERLLGLTGFFSLAQDGPERVERPRIAHEAQTSRKLSIETRPTPENIASCNPQSQSPLFSVLPPEIRAYIFSLALLTFRIHAQNTTTATVQAIALDT
jgi:hypothetical protein